MHNDYLQHWFKESVLAQLSAIVSQISRLPSRDVQIVLRVMLSDILRGVSLQDDADLRIRRRKSPAENMPVIPLFLNSMKNKVETILRAREFIPYTETIQKSLLGDAKYCSNLIKATPEFESVQFDGAITSPPYSTALPYVDMHRLSLVLLGLVSPQEIRVLERSLVGNREITRSHREELEQKMEKNNGKLPSESVAFCLEMMKAVDNETDGFRKQDKPALVYEYFSSMAMMFEQVYQLLKEDAVYALVVGKNTAVLGKTPFLIDTPHHLSLIAQAKGFHIEEIIKLDTYQRFDIHKENSIRSEELLLLRKK
jgi:site-specific DNA-methyltransferase (cytosine-N4-specific)